MSLALLIQLFAASLTSALLYVILKYFAKFKVNNLHGLTANYLTASTFSFLLNFDTNKLQLTTVSEFAPFAISVGFLFIIVFYTAALTSQKAGIAITSIAGKMSMVIPICAGIFLYNDKVNGIRIFGILLAIIAVYLSSKKEVDKENNSSTKNLWIYPLLLFLGSGLVDTCIKYSQQYYITASNMYLFFSVLFGTAGVFGLIATIYNWIVKKVSVSITSILGGVVLGIVNYYSLVFLVNCLAFQGAESAIIFSIVNILVVFFSVILALLLFKEKPSKINFIGLIIAFIAILVLSN